MKEKDLIFCYALYEDGHWERYRDCKDGYIMIVDLGRGRNTIMTNPATTNAVFEFGHYWEEYMDEGNGGEWVIVDDDFVVWVHENVNNETYRSLIDGEINGLLWHHEKGLTYMDKKGNFENL